MAFAEDVSVPEAGPETYVYGDNYDPQADLFGLGVLKAGRSIPRRG